MVYFDSVPPYNYMYVQAIEIQVAGTYLVNLVVPNSFILIQQVVVCNMATDADIEASVLAQLASTDYACSSITRLNGGTANFVYRGVLSNPEGFIGNNTSSREEETDTTDEKKNVIIKHTKDFVALSRDFKLDVQRCVSHLYRLFLFFFKKKWQL